MNRDTLRFLGYLPFSSSLFRSFPSSLPVVNSESTVRKETTRESYDGSGINSESIDRGTSRGRGPRQKGKNGLSSGLLFVLKIWKKEAAC